MTDVDAPGRSLVITVEESGSTQDDLRVLAADASGWPHLSGLRAVRQTAGRGRGGRAWQTDELTALTASLVLRPDIPPAAWPWIPLLAGCAVVEALAHGLARLKWPNDVVLPADAAHADVEGWGSWRKAGGILAEGLPDQSGVLLGIGVNLAGTAPVPWATTLQEHGIDTDPEALLEAIRSHLAQTVASDPATWRDAVEHRCASIGAQVVAHLPGGARITGTAVAIDDAGGLVIAEAGGSERVVMAGDVEHLRASSGEGR
ncbi:biotin--[acetyl-CoA-carboxylase] ligase [Pseudactinotalea sp.]|uniref:biotin--[acetyl-CoA-carboxylase] ligase n=1 Tax=Pseudactinotalea sp. TaxID=1926260 RepID=UPI003B3AA9BB